MIRTLLVLPLLQTFRRYFNNIYPRILATCPHYREHFPQIYRYSFRLCITPALFWWNLTDILEDAKKMWKTPNRLRIVIAELTRGEIWCVDRNARGFVAGGFR